MRSSTQYSPAAPGLAIRPNHTTITADANRPSATRSLKGETVDMVCDCVTGKSNEVPDVMFARRPCEVWGSTGVSVVGRGRT